MAQSVVTATDSNGTQAARADSWRGFEGICPLNGRSPLKNRVTTRALSGGDDGNRTRTTSLEDWSSAIELHPRSAADSTGGRRRRHQATGRRTLGRKRLEKEVYRKGMERKKQKSEGTQWSR